MLAKLPFRLTRTQATIAVAALAVVLLVVGVGVATGLPGAWFASAPTASPSATPEPTRSPTRSPTRRPTPTPSPTPTPAPTPTPFDQALLDSRITVLIAGLDSDYWRRANGLETNTDAMVVASISRDHTRIDMVAMPRDTVDLPMADGSVWTAKINSLSRFLGLEALRGTFETTLGIDIDYYVQVDMDDFVYLVDSIGGIDIYVPTLLHDVGLNLYVEPGWQHFDGARAQFYARTRVDSDYGRQGRQQEILLAIFNKLADPATNVDLLSLIPVLASFESDIPLDKIPTLVEVARRSQGAQATIQVLAPPRFALFTGLDGARGYVMIPNIAEMQAYAQSVMGGD